MSDIFCAATTVASFASGSGSLVDSVALTANVVKTALQVVAPANHRVKILGYGVFFDGISQTGVPVRVRLVRQTSAGTMSASTPYKTSARTESILTTAQFNATVEPALADILDLVTVHPQQGYEVKFAPGQEIIMGGSERIGVELFSTAALNAYVKIFFEE